MTIGKRVYWVANDQLRWGEVVAVNASSNIDGQPRHVVVDLGDEFRIFSASNSWDRFFPTAVEAVMHKVDEMLRDGAHRQKVTADLYKALKEVPAELANV